MRVAVATCALLLALATPASAGTILERWNISEAVGLAAADGPFFLDAQGLDFNDRSFRIQPDRGTARRIRLPGGDLRAGGDTVAVQRTTSDRELEGGPVDTEVVAAPAAGGPFQTVVRAHADAERPGDPGTCGRYVQLMDVTTDGRVIVNESRKPCDFHRLGHGALYSYGPEGRRLLTRSHVQSAGAWNYEQYARVAGPYVVLTGHFGPHGLESTYLIDTRTGAERRLVHAVGVYDQDVNAGGNAVVSYQPSRGANRVRLFLPDGTSRVVARVSGLARGQFCGEGLAVFQWYGRLVSLTFRDRPTAPPRTLLFEKPYEGFRGLSACNSRRFAFVDERLGSDGTQQTLVRAYSLRP